ncbi:MAG: type II toxin-antitoxin system RelE/ParE family toxin [Gammaproteobacteria bacterium]
MDVLFTDEKTQRALSNQRDLRRRFGALGAKKITLRLQQLAAAPTLADMRPLPGRCHELSGDRAGCFAVDVHQPYRLVFQPTSSMRDPDTSEDWDAIDSVTIIEVVNYH